MNEFQPADSDIDFLVEFHPGIRYSLLDLGGMWMELRDIVGREVDLKTPLDLSSDKLPISGIGSGARRLGEE